MMFIKIKLRFKNRLLFHLNLGVKCNHSNSDHSQPANTFHYYKFEKYWASNILETYVCIIWNENYTVLNCILLIFCIKLSEVQIYDFRKCQKESLVNICYISGWYFCAYELVLSNLSLISLTDRRYIKWFALFWTYKFSIFWNFKNDWVFKNIYWSHIIWSFIGAK